MHLKDKSNFIRYERLEFHVMGHLQIDIDGRGSEVKGDNSYSGAFPKGDLASKFLTL